MPQVSYAICRTVIDYLDKARVQIKFDEHQCIIITFQNKLNIFHDPDGISSDQKHDENKQAALAMKLKSRYQYDGTISVLKCTNNLKKKGIRLANKKKTHGEKHISDLSKSLICALVDSGSQVTTAHHQWLLHKYKNINFEKYLSNAGKKMAHKVIGKGCMKIPN
eukprot:6731100-Ditylum_brightwellii.AAC.1